MSRIWLVHWNAREAAEYAAVLCNAGHDVTAFSDQRAGKDLQRVRDDPPDAFILVLDRLPSHGRAVGQWLRETKATRHVPLVFLGGEPTKVARIHALLPDATYTSWTRLEVDLEAAIRNPPRSPARPGTLAGYSGTPLPRKLGIQADSAVLLLGAPAGFETTLGALPGGVRLGRQARGSGDVVLLFARSVADLEKRFPAAARAMSAKGRIWIAWPKKTSGVRSDVTEQYVRAFGLSQGFVDYKICAIDATWSGLCFARRAARTGTPARRTPKPA